MSNVLPDDANYSRFGPCVNTDALADQTQPEKETVPPLIRLTVHDLRQKQALELSSLAGTDGGTESGVYRSQVIPGAFCRFRFV